MTNFLVSKSDQRNEINALIARYREEGGTIKVCRASYRKPGSPPKTPNKVKIIKEK